MFFFLYFFQASATLSKKNAWRRGCVHVAAGDRNDFVVESKLRYTEVSTLLTLTKPV